MESTSCCKKVRSLEVLELGVCQIMDYGRFWERKHRYLGAVCIPKTWLALSKYWVMVLYPHSAAMLIFGAQIVLWGVKMSGVSEVGSPRYCTFGPRARRSKIS
jgi:hypothetical protein